MPARTRRSSRCHRRQLTKRYDHVKEHTDLPDITMQQVEHFFEHYKDLEPGKWVRIGDWLGAAEARQMIVEAIDRAHRKAERERG